MYKLILAITLLFSQVASAEIFLYTGMWSNHLTDGEYNEKHDAVGLEINNIFLYRYTNSSNNTSFFLGHINRDEICLERLCAGYSYGVLTGYKDTDLQPVAFGVLSYDIPTVGGIDISCLPTRVCALNVRLLFDVIDIPEHSYDIDGSFEVAVDSFDPDYKEQERSTGMSFKGIVELGEGFFIQASYLTTKFTVHNESCLKSSPTGCGVSGLLDVSGQYSASIGGYWGDYRIRTSYSVISLRKVGYEGSYVRQGGLGLHIGREFQITERLSSYVEIGVLNRTVLDYRIEGVLSYAITDTIKVNVRTIDWGIWNYSQYQVGFEYKF